MKTSYFPRILGPALLAGSLLFGNGSSDAKESLEQQLVVESASKYSTTIKDKILGLAELAKKCGDSKPKSTPKGSFIIYELTADTKEYGVVVFTYLDYDISGNEVSDGKIGRGDFFQFTLEVGAFRSVSYDQLSRPVKKSLEDEYRGYIDSIVNKLPSKCAGLA